MMRHLLFLSCLAVAACTHMQPNPIPPELIYPPTLNANTITNATLTGKEQHSKGWGLDRQTAYLLSIDGKMVEGERKSWNQVFELSPGLHQALVRFQFGSHQIQSTLKFEARALQQYRLNFAGNFGTWLSNNSQLDLWIEDVATGEKVSKPVSGLNDVSPTSSPLYLPVIINK